MSGHFLVGRFVRFQGLCTAEAFQARGAVELLLLLYDANVMMAL